jgi:LuxR family transcriptional regulator, maltose regulon positive regulatory protein
MAKDIPMVRQAILEDPRHNGSSIPLDTPEWFAWLDAPTTTRFSYALHNRAQGYIDGFMTVRKETRQRGRHYWSVYRRSGPKVRKIYVGPSTALTLNRLEQIATRLRGPP